MPTLARILLASAAVTSVTGALVAACNTYDESLLEPAPDATTPQGPSGRGFGYWSDDDGTCRSAGRPRPEDKPRVGQNGAELPPIVVGLIRIDLGTTNPVDGGAADTEWKRLGFDVDGLCTGRSSTCSPGDQPACKPLRGETPVDGEYCRDNSFGSLATTLTYASSLTAEFGFGTFDCALCSGAMNFLVRISGYNGQADDDAIEVDFYPAVGLDTPLPITCSAQLPESACFRSFMPWRIDRRVVTGANPGDSPSTLRSVGAFVRDSYVTVFLPETMRFYFPGEHTIIRPFPITLHDGFLTGRISKAADDTWRVDDGLIGGTTRVPELLQSLRDIGLCEGDTNYVVAQGVIENVADVLGSGAIEPNTPCDSVSVGVGFTAVQATLGPAVEAPLYDYCGADAGTDGGSEAGTDGGNEAGTSSSSGGDAGDE